MQGGTPIPEDEVRQALARALEGVRRTAEPEEPLSAWIEWLRAHANDDTLEVLGVLLLVALIVGAIAVVGNLVLKHAFQRRPSAGEFVGGEGPEPDPAALARALAGAARAARDAGDLRLALRLFLQAVLVALGGRGDLELRPAWTNRELLARGKPSPAAQALLAPLVRELEPQEFGRAPVSAADVQRLEALLAEHLEGAP
ncbi:MAG: DUF4129 domain-containing protein [Planctomycetes bacterium]|nr:DUF4129 domain-containing protein [Planctomycetota bacterium]